MQEQTWAIIVVGIAIMSFTYTIMRNMREDLTKRIDALSGKVAQTDVRLIEVEKLFFSICTLLHYDNYIDSPEEK